MVKVVEVTSLRGIGHLGLDKKGQRVGIHMSTSNIGFYTLKKNSFPAYFLRECKL